MNSISRLREGNDLEQRRCSLASRIANLILRICLNAASGLDLGASDGALAGEFVKYGIKFYGVEPSLDDKEAERNRAQIRKGWAHSIPFENGVDEVADEVMTIMSLTGVRRVYEPILHGVGWPGDVKRVALKIERLKALGFKPMINSRKAIRTAVKKLIEGLNGS